MVSLKHHWPEYLMEAVGLGIFMLSACLFGTILEYPSSPVRLAIHEPLLRRFLMGLAMGLTAIAIIYSPWGKQSGAHINPAVTLTFFRLGKTRARDAVFYICAQFIGGAMGVSVAALVLRELLGHPAVNYVVTAPGPAGVAAAFFAEMIITFVLMLTILIVSNTPRMQAWTGVFAGILVATYITFEAPLSGMSMNPARTFASALTAGAWTSWWIYFSAPVLGMLLAAQLYLRVAGARRIFCAKLVHAPTKRCIFCGYRAQSENARVKQRSLNPLSYGRRLMNGLLIRGEGIDL